MVLASQMSGCGNLRTNHAPFDEGHGYHRFLVILAVLDPLIQPPAENLQSFASEKELAKLAAVQYRSLDRNYWQ